jgi:transposase
LRYGKWRSVHRRFSRWCKAGTFQKIFKTLIQHDREEFETIHLDSSIVRGHQHSAGALKKNNRGEYLGRRRYYY